MSDTEPLLGIDPDDTAEVRIGGAVFTVGVIEHGLWLRISNEAFGLYRTAHREAIRRLAAEGIDPEAPADDDERAKADKGERFMKLVDLAASADPTYTEKLHRVMVDAVRYGARGHTGFVLGGGRQVPFATVEEKYEGATVRALDAETLRVYRANGRVVQSLYSAIRKLQELRPAEKKVSPPPSSSTG